MLYTQLIKADELKSLDDLQGSRRYYTDFRRIIGDNEFYLTGDLNRDIENYEISTIWKYSSNEYVQGAIRGTKTLESYANELSEHMKGLRGWFPTWWDREHNKKVRTLDELISGAKILKKGLFGKYPSFFETLLTSEIVIGGGALLYNSIDTMQISTITPETLFIISQVICAALCITWNSDYTLKDSLIKRINYQAKYIDAKIEELRDKL